MAAKADAGENLPWTHPEAMPELLLAGAPPPPPPPQASSSAVAGINASTNDVLWGKNMGNILVENRRASNATRCHNSCLQTSARLVAPFWVADAQSSSLP
jgi:hypothetical protein